MRYRYLMPLLAAAVAGGLYLAAAAYVHRTSEASLRRAVLLAQMDEPLRAREALRWLLWFEPDHPGALHLTGLSYLQQGDYAAAIEYLQRVKENTALHAEVQATLAGALLADQQFQRAEAVLSAQVSRYPKSIIARRQLGGLLLTERRRREAVHVLEEYIRVTVTDSLALADRLLMLRDLATAEFHPPAADRCLPTLEESLRRHPHQPAVRAALAHCYWEVGRPHEAETQAREILQQNSENGQARWILGTLLLERGDFDAAEAALAGHPEGSFAPSALVEPWDDRFWELRSRIAEARGEFGEAIAALDRAVELRPQNREYESRRARLLQRLQRTEDAQAAYARAHAWARAELDLWDLSRDLGVRTPAAAECLRMAQLYEALGRKWQATAWRRLREQLIAETSPAHAP